MNLSFFEILNKDFKFRYLFVFISLFIISWLLISIGSVPVYVMLLVERDIIIPYLPTFIQKTIQEKTFSELILFSSYLLILIFFKKYNTLFINLLIFIKKFKKFLSEEIYKKYLLSDYINFKLKFLKFD